MPRFFISPDEPTRERMLLDEQESHHASSVLRLAAGERAELLDGRGRVLAARVDGFEQGRLALRVTGEKRAARPIPIEITLAAAVIRPERFDLLIEKATELGAAVIAPIVTERSIVKLSRERWTAKTGRWNKIVRESCKQCGQAFEPRVEPARPLKAFLDSRAVAEPMLIPTLEAVTRRPLSAALEDVRRSDRRTMTWLIGPEGDFTEEEVASVLDRGGAAVDLGPLVLRSETAAWYALSATYLYFREGLHAITTDH